MWQNFKRMGCYLIIIMLLPYVITVFLNGPVVSSSGNTDTLTVKAEHDGSEVEISMEEYCIGRLAREIPPDCRKEAIKAQAVLVRTAVCREFAESGTGAILPDDFWTQEDMKDNWGTGRAAAHYEKFRSAWQETEGQVLMYDGKPANAPYCRLTNGNTRDGKEVLESEDYPYLKIRECPMDLEAREQVQTVVLDDLDAEVTAVDTAGYVLSVRVGEETINGEEFRKTYGLASSCFTLGHYDGSLRVTTRGIGHGLGLSQYTADQMAGEGASCEEILDYFFEGTEIREVADIVTASE